MSSHSRGVAVDLTLIDREAETTLAAAAAPCGRTGKVPRRAGERDMGTGFDCFDPTSHTGARELAAAARANRDLLLAAMRRHGFRNYEREWWHFSFQRSAETVPPDTPIPSRRP